VRGDPLPDAKPAELDSLLAAARHAHQHLHGDHIDYGFRFVAGLAKDLIEHELPTVFLKQIRAIEDGMGAALQQIAEARYTVKRFRARPLMHSYHMTVHPLDSQPLADELGLTSGPGPPRLRMRDRLPRWGWPGGLGRQPGVVRTLPQRACSLARDPRRT
jgi:hypothetical protein